MTKRGKITVTIIAGVLVLGAAVAVAGPIVYRDFLATPAAQAPTLTAGDMLTPSTGELLTAAELNGTWNVADGSEAGYRVNEVLNGTDVTVTGRTSEVSGSYTADELTLTAAEFTVEVASITTDSSQRDQYFYDSALRVADYPTATFTLTTPVSIDAPPLAGETLTQELTGDLTLAGVTQSVIFTAEVRTDGKTTEIAGQIPIVFSDFGVTAPSLGFVAVEDRGFVEFDLITQKG